MANRPMFRATLALSLVLCAATACRKQDASPVDRTAPATPAAESNAATPRTTMAGHAPREAEGRLPAFAKPRRDTAPVDASVTEVRLSNRGDADAGTIGPVTSSFARKDTVYAQVDTSGSAASYSLYARWIAPDKTVLSDYGLHVGRPGLVHTIISLSKPDGWSPGEHRIELAINGKAQRTVVFQVR